MMLERTALPRIMRTTQMAAALNRNLQIRMYNETNGMTMASKATKRVFPTDHRCIVLGRMRYPASVVGGHPFESSAEWPYRG